MRLRLLLAAGCALAASAPAVGQQGPVSFPDSLRDRFRLPEVPVNRTGGYTPSITITSPTGFGAERGNAYVGAAFQNRTRFTGLRDGSVFAGIGVGDAQRVVAAEVTLTSYSLGRDDTPGATGGLSVKVHRLLPGLVSVAAGVENLAGWGNGDGGRSVYATASGVVRLNDDPHRRLGALFLTGGVGGGRFRSEADIFAQRGGAGVFGSVALLVAEPVTVVADWSGQDLSVGASFIPIRRVPLVITPALVDVTGNAGDGTRFVLGAAYGIRFPSPI